MPSASPLRLRADLAGLARLAADALTRVLHTLRLVRVRDTKGADLRRDLTDDFLVGARDADLLRRLEREADASRRVDLDRMREAERELQLLARERGPVARSTDLEITDVAGRDALDHVGEQRARETVDGPRLLALVRPHDRERRVGPTHRDERMEGPAELALRPLHRDLSSAHLHVDAVRDVDGKLADATHSFSSSTRRTPGPRHRAPSARPRGRS